MKKFVGILLLVLVCPCLCLVGNILFHPVPICSNTFAFFVYGSILDVLISIAIGFAYVIAWYLT